MTRSALSLALAVLAMAFASPIALAQLRDHANQEIPATSSATPTAQLVGAPTPVARLAAPNTPGDDDPAALAALGSPTGPEDDLGDALAAMASATSAGEAAAQRAGALAILRGDALPGEAYSGIPLLNWNVPARVRDVPAGGTVTVRIVRSEGRALSDTWLLRFADPDAPFTIAYELADLAPGRASELAPTPLLADAGGPVGGLHSALVHAGVDPLDTGTSTSSRFTDARGLSAGAPEQTRSVVRRYAIRMPPPRYVEAILDPALLIGGATTATADVASLGVLRAAASSRIDAAAAQMGFRGTTPNDAERDAAIRRIGARAPERQAHDALAALDPAASTFLEDARAVGAQSVALVGTMRDHDVLPPGFAGDATADASVVLLNGEPYRSTRSLRPDAAGALRVSVTNGDELTRRVELVALGGRRDARGAQDWGTFTWDTVDPRDVSLAPGESATLAVQVTPDAFALVVGDPDGGDRATTALRIARAPPRQSLDFGGGAVEPLHIAQDAAGDLWVTLSGIDTLARVSPAADLGAARVERFPLPGGNLDGTATPPPLAPHDVAVDGRGVVWVTLTAGSAIARLDPAAVRDGTSDGIRIYPLPPCEDDACRTPFPPEVPPAPPTRGPLQMDVMLDGAENTVVLFTEEDADRIGMLRVAPDGTKLGSAAYPCGCTVPLGLAIAPDGDVWFSEGVDSRIGRLRLDTTRPWVASTVRVEHFDIPSGVEVVDPALSPLPIRTAAPHSLAIEPTGRVWFSESATGILGLLDPARASPGTSEGITETTLADDPFGRVPVPADLTVDRDGAVFWADEYGDIVGRLLPDGRQTALRPAERNSLTDAPLIDDRGDLWFLEAGAGLLTRIAGVSAGSDRPGPPPIAIADVAAERVTVSRLTRTTGADVAVTRGGAVVAHASSVPVGAGELRVGDGGAPWDAGSADLRAGDVVRISPLGPRAPRPFELTIADLAGTTDDAGTVGGRALIRGVAGADTVTVDPDGDAAALRAAIDPDGGAFSAQLPTGSPRSGTLTWSTATPAAIARTVARFAPQPAAAPAAGGDGLAGSAVPAPGAGGDRLAGSQPAAVPPSGRTDPPAATRPALPRCRLWLLGTQRRVALLGELAARARRCLGVPDRRRVGRGSQLWTYRGGATLRLVRGRVVEIVLTAGSLTAAPPHLRIGSSRGAARRALRGLRPVGRRLLVAALKSQRGRAAELRVVLGRGRTARVTRIAIRLRGARLDRATRRPSIPRRPR